MIYPEFLKEGNTIGVPAPSSGGADEVHINRFKNAVKKMKEKGYNIVESKNMFKNDFARSASAEVRGKEINDMFSDDNIDFLIALAGGEFLVECLPYIDFDMIASKKKYFCGFSDPTGIIWPLTTKYDISTIYGMNFGEYGIEEYENITNNLEIIKGNLVEQKSFEKYDNGETKSLTGLEGYDLTEKNEWKVLNGKKAKFSGRVLAGCFDLIAELAGTKYDGTPEFVDKYKDDGIVYIFDNCELSKEETIRVLWKFNELGYFKYCNGVMFGKFGVDNGISYSGYENVEQCLRDSVLAKLNIPVIFDADVSHKDPSMTIVNGSIITIESENGKGTIKMELK